ncbi:hypothetical protein V8F20_008385 [Naviculisporaceae sp. PSN 640]
MSSKPVLRVSTPVTANFPSIPPSASELRSAISLPSAVSDRTPLSAISRTSAFRDPLPSAGLPSAGLPSAGPLSATVKLEYDLQKTPITPPVAYLDFLKSMSLVSPSLASPPQTGRAVINRTSTASSTLSNSSSSSTESAKSDESEKEKGEQIESAPSTARTELSESDDEEKPKEEKRPKSPKQIPAPINTKLPPTPRNTEYPLSAPAAGSSVFPSLKLPASPAVSTAGLYSPRSPLRSPLSAASVRSPFDWDAALKSRKFGETAGAKRQAAPDTPTTKNAPAKPGPGHSKRESRSSVRHIREVVTRTVTYTPRMGPAPKGKRRKLDTETAVKT